MRDDFQIWVDAVCQCVRFQPDRRAIAKELRAHYEDHCRDLERLNYDPALAGQRALEAMGNAQEVGYALDRVHKPWLGWLWEVSRVMVLALALLLACKAGQNNYDTRSLTKLTWNQFTWPALPPGASHAATDYLDIWLVPGEPEPYRVPGGEEPLPGETRVQVPMTLWVETRDVFHGHLEGLYSYLEITVDGHQALQWGDYVAEDRSRLDSGYYLWFGTRESWTHYRDGLLLVLESPPQRVEMTHPWAGWTLTAEWEGVS